jgi:hypothetical protein
MASQGEDVERATIREARAPGTGAAGWWIAAIVAIVAVVGLIFIFNSQNRADELQAAREQGMVQANLDNAAAEAQRAATRDSQSAQSAVASTARASQRAAEAAQVAANETVQEARAAESAAQNASATEQAQPAPAQQ